MNLIFLYFLTIIFCFDLNGFKCTDVGEPLILTPFIKAGKIEEAQKLALVRNISDVPITSYTGFLTVNESCGSNLFFWFVPSTHESPKDTPLILWLNGGPGSTSLYGFFLEHGPLKVDVYNVTHYRPYTWTSTNSVIYVDSPVGTGFSYTDGNCYRKYVNEVSEDLYIALSQFFILFPIYKNNEFYVAGQSYGGKYAPAISNKIHVENSLKKDGEWKINLKGMGVGSGFFDPISQSDLGEFFYSIGWADEEAKKFLIVSEKMTRSEILKKNYTAAYQIMEPTVLGLPKAPSTYLQNVSGMALTMNYLKNSDPEELYYFQQFLEIPYVRKEIHVGSLDFNVSSDIVYDNMNDDIYQSVRPQVENLLNNNYKVLFWAGQLDPIVPHVSIVKALNQLQWNGKEDYLKAERSQWRVKGELAGYSKSGGNLTYLLVKDAGHMAPFDQPEWCFDLINRFTRNEPFDKAPSIDYVKFHAHLKEFTRSSIKGDIIYPAILPVQNQITNQLKNFSNKINLNQFFFLSLFVISSLFQYIFNDINISFN